MVLLSLLSGRREEEEKEKSQITVTILKMAMTRIMTILKKGEVRKRKNGYLIFGYE